MRLVRNQGATYRLVWRDKGGKQQVAFIVNALALPHPSLIYFCLSGAKEIDPQMGAIWFSPASRSLPNAIAKKFSKNYVQVGPLLEGSYRGNEIIDALEFLGYREVRSDTVTVPLC